MRVEVDFEGGKNAAGIYVHKKLPEAMGNSVAAFAHAVLSGHTQPGVWYPEEKEALAVSNACLCVLGVGAVTEDILAPINDPLNALALLVSKHSRLVAACMLNFLIKPHHAPSFNQCGRVCVCVCLSWC